MIISLRYSLFFICSCFFWGELQAQNAQLYLTHFGSSTGLSFGHVNDAEFDREGFLWVATANGLNKFDGNHVTKYFGYSQNGGEVVSGDFIKGICCDSLVVWVAVKQGGLNCYMNMIDHFIKYLHDPQNPYSLASNNINCMLLASNKKLYLGTDNGLSIYNRSETRFTNIDAQENGKSPADITSIAEGENREILLGTSAQGMFILEGKQAKLLPLHIPPGLNTARINDLLYDKKNRGWWMATSNGLWHARLDSNDSLVEFSRPLNLLTSTCINCIKESPDGDLWIGTEKQGVFLYAKNGSLIHYGAGDTNKHALASNRINKISAENDGSIWFSTEYGLSALFPDLQHFPFFNIYGAAANDSVAGITPGGLCTWKNYIVAATGGGVVLVDTGLTRMQQLCLNDNSKTPIGFSDATLIDDHVFLTGTDGVYQIIQSGNSFALARPPIFYAWLKYISKPCKKLFKLGGGAYLLTTVDGYVFRIDTEQKKVDTLYMAVSSSKTTNTEPIQIQSFPYSTDKIILASGWDIGVYSNTGKLVLKAGDARFFDKLSHKCIINDFFYDGKDLWFATAGRGLYRCNTKLDIVTQYTTENGLCDNALLCLQDDDKGRLWLTTKNGLSVFDRRMETFVNYSQEQGLPSNEFEPNGKTCSNKQTLYFSTAEGITRVKPGEWKTETSPEVFPSIVRATIGEKNFTPADISVLNEMRQIEVSYGNNIALSFDVVSLAHTGNYTLQYRLDKTPVWNDLTKGADLLLNKLSPGSHELMVRAMAKTEKRFGDTVRLSIHIESVYYQQWWFIVFVLLTAGLLVYLIYSYRVRNIVRIYEVRNKIARDLHDEVGATLSGIAMYSHLAKEQMKKASLPEMENSLNIIQHGAGEMVNKLNDIVWLVNPEQDSWQKLVQRLEEYAADMAALKNISLKISSTKNIPKVALPLETRRNIYLFCKEAINNAVKYSDCTLLELVIQETDRKLAFSVKDNGRGFDMATVKPGNGLNNMKKRAAAIDAKLVIYANPGEGSLLSMQVKIT